MRLTLKSGASSQGKEVDIDDGADVKTLREKVVSTFKDDAQYKDSDLSTNKVVLIFGGKILKDDQTLAAASIKDGLKVHVVFKNVKKGGTSSAGATSSTSSTPAQPAPTPAAQPAAPTTATPGTTTGGGGAAGLGNFFGTNMSGQNFQQMQQEMMRNPEMMSQIMNNPLIQSILGDENVMQEMFRANPQIQQLMRDQPEIQHLLEDPATMRRMMDMARNPGAMQEMVRQQDRAMQNLEAIPGGMNHLRRVFNDVVEPMQDAVTQNPFDQLANAGNNNTDNAAANNDNNTEQTSALPNPWATRPANNNNANSAGQMPQMSEGLQRALMNNILSNQPGAENIPQEARDRMASLFGNRTAMEAMQRPAVREAMQQIQQGVAVLSREAPELAEAMGIPTGMAGMNLGGGLPAGLGGGLPAGFGGLGGLGGARQPPAPPANPEETYRTQLGDLQNMGFTDTQRNIQALTRANGDLTQAINFLLQ